VNPCNMRKRLPRRNTATGTSSGSEEHTYHVCAYLQLSRDLCVESVHQDHRWRDGILSDCHEIGVHTPWDLQRTVILSRKIRYPKGAKCRDLLFPLFLVEAGVLIEYLEILATTSNVTIRVVA